jgi:hypothetical protein
MIMTLKLAARGVNNCFEEASIKESKILPTAPSSFSLLSLSTFGTCIVGVAVSTEGVVLVTVIDVEEEDLSDPDSWTHP